MTILMVLFFLTGRILAGQGDVREIIKKSDAFVEFQKESVESFLKGLSQGDKHQNWGELLNGGPSCQNCKVQQLGYNQQDLDTQFIVFVSLSMPKRSLQALYQDMAKIGGRLVIRGLKNDSFQETQNALTELGIGLDIDPPLFDEFEIKAVPTFVHARGRDGKPEVQDHDRLQGNVTVKYALETFKEKGNLKGAELFLPKLEGQK